MRRRRTRFELAKNCTIKSRLLNYREKDILMLPDCKTRFCICMAVLLGLICSDSLLGQETSLGEIRGDQQDFLQTGTPINGDSLGVRLPSFVPQHQRVARNRQNTKAAPRTISRASHKRTAQSAHASYRSVVNNETMIRSTGNTPGRVHLAAAQCGIEGCTECATPGCADCGTVGCGGCGVESVYGMGYSDCGDCGLQTCTSCNFYPYPRLISFVDMEYHVGVHSFKGPMNLGQGASFGINEGINWGFPLPPVLPFVWSKFSGQLGFRATHSNFAGTAFRRDTREQVFVTGGIFRRVDYGFQIGAVLDYLHEEWYFKGGFAQLRAQIGWKNPYGNEWGFQLAANMHEETGLGAIVTPLLPPGAAPITQIVPNDTYRFYYKHNLRQIENGRLEMFGGFTSESQGLLGCDIGVQLAERLELRSGFLLVLEDSVNTFETNVDESWNIYSSIVFYPKGLNRWKRAYHAPLFPVADNGSFLMSR